MIMKCDFTYQDVLLKLLDLKQLTNKPEQEEFSGTFTSYDRNSVYDDSSDSYLNWGANGDNNGFIRRDGKENVALELDGPGIIWRIWSAKPEKGLFNIYIDNKCVYRKSFSDFFHNLLKKFQELDFLR